jgi:hypothetical protein
MRNFGDEILGKKLLGDVKIGIYRKRRVNEKRPHRLNTSKKMATNTTASPLLFIYIHFFRQMNHKVCSFLSVCPFDGGRVFLG